MEDAATNYMHTFIWDEATAVRGDDNIVLPLHHDLEDRIFVVTKYKIDHLLYVCDNLIIVHGWLRHDMIQR